MPAPRPIPTALTIAGSDSGGGAGIQADLKTFSALGVYGMSALTAVTAQNTVAVQGILALPPDLVTQQIDAVMTDIGADAAKTGMLFDVGIIEAVAEAVQRHRLANLVVDPVMVAKSGDRLLQQEAVSALAERLAPLALVITPNLPEAEALAEMDINFEADVEEAARRIRARGPRYVVIKGGHAQGAATDLVFDGKRIERLSAPRIDTGNTHGTGCTFSAAIAAGLAKGQKPLAAISDAKTLVT
ncbi:MAG: bifunctional hydroxymethylpyrimidine kinase/phosphomethylpyrimidine kinase, partial [Armatimonadota bacterium]